MAFSDPAATAQDPVRIAVHVDRRTPSGGHFRALNAFSMQPVQDFVRIAAHLDRRSPGDCVQFYYRSQKLDAFAAVRRKLQLRKRRMQARGLNPETQSPMCWIGSTWAGATGDVSLPDCWWHRAFRNSA